MRTMLLPTTAKTRKKSTATKPPASTSTATTTPVTPSNKVQFAYPTTSDPTMAALLPWDDKNGYPAAAQVVVDAAGNGDYTSIGAALKDVSNRRTVPMAVANISTPDPRVRVDIMVTANGDAQNGDAGIAIPQFVAVFAQDPATTVRPQCKWGMEMPSGVFWWGVDITNVDNNGQFDPKYAIHHHADQSAGSLGGTNGGGGTTVVAGCTLNNIAPHAGGYPTPIGEDASQGGTLLMYNMTFASGTYTNLHGWPTGSQPLSGQWVASRPGMTVIFDKLNWPTGSPMYSSSNDDTNDQLWVTNSTVSAAYLKGDKTDLHVANTTVTGKGDPAYSGHKKQDGVTAASGITDTRSDYPLPKGSISAFDRTMFGLKAMV